MPAFVPDGGELVWLSFDPQAGHQAGRRPALVVSPKSYNLKSGPVASQIKGYPFEVPVPAGCRVNGVILADHLKSLDWKARRVERITRVPLPTLNEVLARLAPLLGY